MIVHLIDRKERVAELLLEIRAVHCNIEQPFIFTSGWASPVYVDCRRLVSTPRQRWEIIELIAEGIDRNIGRDQFDIVAGGRDGGHPLRRLDRRLLLRADDLRPEEAQGGRAPGPD